MLEQVGGVALGERGLAEAGDLFLVAGLRGAALLGAAALRQVARIHHQHPALRRVDDAAPALHGEGAAVLAAILARHRVAARRRAEQLGDLAAQALRRRIGAYVGGAQRQQLGSRVAERRADGLVEIEQRAVAQPEQEHHVGGGVERGAEALQRRLALLALGDFLEHRDLVQRHAGRVARQRDRQRHPQHRAVLAEVALLEARRRQLAAAHALALDVGHVAVVGVREILDRAADQLGLAVAEHLAQAPVDAQEAAVERHVGDAGGGELEGLAEALFALRERRLRLLALQELADLAADHVDGLQQPLVGLVRPRAGEAQHADRLALEDHREDEGAAAQARAARKRR
jgi:hypothetical protein